MFYAILCWVKEVVDAPFLVSECDACVEFDIVYFLLFWYPAVFG
jgi:hypothetical protein